MTISSLTRRMLLSVALGVLVIFVLSFSADLPRLLRVLESFQWRVIPLVIGLTLFNYVLRFVKWNYYLGVVGVTDVPLPESAMIFTAGLSMVITPGKVGELLKSYLLRHSRGTPIGTSAPILIAERLTDGVAMVLLASGGLLFYGIGWQMLIPIVGGMVAVLVVSQNRSLSQAVIRLLEKLPIVGTRVHHLEAALESAYLLFRARNLVLAIGLGIVSWGAEAVAFYIVLTALGLTPSLVLFVQAAFILSSSSILGAASMLPGGLAVADGSIAGLLLLVGVTHDPSVAAAATLIIRFATLWFGVVVGLVGLAIAASRLKGADLSNVRTGLGSA